MDKATTTKATAVLADLKKQIDNEVLPMIAELPRAYDRYNAYMSILRDNWQDEYLQKAYAEAKRIKDESDRVFALQSISYEIANRLRDLDD